MTKFEVIEYRIVHQHSKAVKPYYRVELTAKDDTNGLAKYNLVSRETVRHFFVVTKVKNNRTITISTTDGSKLVDMLGVWVVEENAKERL